LGLSLALFHAEYWRANNHAIGLCHAEHGANRFERLIVSRDTLIPRKKLCGLAGLDFTYQPVCASWPSVSTSIQDSDLVRDGVGREMLNGFLEPVGQPLERDLPGVWIKALLLALEVFQLAPRGGKIGCSERPFYLLATEFDACEVSSA
jgi:hypothetical protein